MAKQAGYPRPIMHGLGNFGVAAHAVLKTFCDYDPKSSSSFASAFPRRSIPARRCAPRCGATAKVVSFRSRVVERDVIAVNNGRAEVRP